MPAEYVICGFRDPPYKLVVVFTHGATKVLHRSHSPVEARAAHDRVSRNPKVIERIELHDHEGVLETIWNKNWD